MRHVVLAYAGDLAGSIALGWLAQQQGTRVVTLTLDVGQGRTFEDVRERALALGAVRAHVIDARDEFVRDYLWPALAAGAMRSSLRLGRALVAPLVARHLTAVADIERATVVAHAGSEPAVAERIHRSVRALNRALEVVPVIRNWGIGDRDHTAFAAVMGLPSAWIDEDTDRGANLWERAAVSARAEDDAFCRTRAIDATPDARAVIDIAFEQGVPVAVNGVPLSNAELIVAVDTIAGVHGVGRTEAAAGHFAYEAPAAIVLEAAHTALQRHVLADGLDAVAKEIGDQYADLVMSGGWYGPARAAVDTFVNQVRRSVTGDVAVTLFKGSCQVTAVRPGGASTEPIAATPALLGKDI